MEEVAKWLRSAVANTDSIENDKTLEAQQMLEQIEAVLVAHL